MLTKVYTALLALAIVITGSLTLYSWTWLGSIGSPAQAVEGYEYYAAISWPILWSSATVLLIVANSVLWVSGRTWPMWTTLIFFQIFVLLRAFWLDPAVLAFRNSSGMTDQTFTVAPLLAVIMVIVAAAIVFFDQFLIIRFRQKTFPETVEAPSEPMEADSTRSGNDNGPRSA